MLRQASALVVAALLPCTACVVLNPYYDAPETDVTSASSTTATDTTTPASASVSSAGTTDTTGTIDTAGTTDTTGSDTNTTSSSSGTSSGGQDSDSDSDSDSDTSMGDPVCGDGSLDSGEECDDGNLDAGDACSPLCHIPPTGVELVGESTTQQAGKGMLNDKAECGSSEALLKLDGRLAPEMWHCEPSFSCGGLTLGADLSVTTQVNATLGPFGFCPEPSTSWEQSCAPGHALVGFSGRNGSVIDNLQPRCAPIQILEDADGFTIITGTTVALEPIGGDGGEPFGPHDCPANAVAVSASLRAGNWLETIQFTCKTLALSFD